MKLSALFGVAAMAFGMAQLGSAQAAMIACLPTAAVSTPSYFVDCPTSGINCVCREGYVALNLFDTQDGQTTGSGTRVEPASATPG
jgi:hypothetical protein